MIPNRTLSTDLFHLKVLNWYIVDVRNTLGEDFLRESPNPAFDLYGYRTNQPALPKHSDRYRMKCRIQYRDYLKRYVCQNDVYSQESLHNRAIDDFVKTQQRLCTNSLAGSITQRSAFIVQKARTIIKEILRDYNVEEHYALCYFGKRSSVGVPYRDSYLDVKAETLTGSNAQIDWWRDYVETDALLKSACSADCKPVDSLTITTVPKSWKARRTVMKNTTLGALFTGGLGKLMVKRLDEYGYENDLTSLGRRSEYHRSLMRKLSISRSHATGDLSSASDSFTYELVNRLFPREWVRAMNLGRIRIMKDDVTDSFTRMSSFMTMGIGFTFPAQTIAFYAVLEAIRRELNQPGFVSVFGDDLIYPRTIHPYVSVVLTDLGFILNKEKTYVDEYYRESCGSDFYAGLDVRPFSPEGSFVELSGVQALAYLYKVYNGWLRRWDTGDIPNVLSYILDEILRFTERIHQVPKDYPDYAGIKLVSPIFGNPIWEPVRYSRNCSPTFSCLGLSRVARNVPAQIIYLWDDLRSKADDQHVDDIFAKEEDSTTFFWRAQGAPCRPYTRTTRCGRQKVEKRRLVPTVSRKGIEPHLVVTTKVTTAWS